MLMAAAVVHGVRCVDMANPARPALWARFGWVTLQPWMGRASGRPFGKGLAWNVTMYSSFQSLGAHNWVGMGPKFRPAQPVFTMSSGVQDGARDRPTWSEYVRYGAGCESVTA